jgi:ribosome-associated protein
MLQTASKITALEPDSSPRKPRQARTDFDNWQGTPIWVDERLGITTRLKPLTSCSYLMVVALDARGSGTERKGPLSTVAIARGSNRRSPELVSTVRPDAEETLRIVLARLDDMKAEDTTVIDLRTQSTLCDYMVVTSGRSNRHVGAVADQVLEGLRGAGFAGLRVEGLTHCDWVLIDAGDVIVHVFRPEIRAFYNLEKMWSRGRAATRQAS